MPSQSIRIVLTDAKIVEQLRTLHKEPNYFLAKPAELPEYLGRAELFLLDDATALSFLEKCPEERRPSVVVIAPEGATIPQSYSRGLVDDLLTAPVRALDVERMLRTHEYVQALRDLEHSSRAIPGLVRQLHDDIHLAQKIQRRLIREKFPPLGPLSVKSKYWCGLKPGGDFFDVFEFPGGTHAGVILSDSSSYSLSTGFIGSLMQFSVHMGKDNLDNPSAIVKALFGKLREGMKESDRLSLLYGILDRKTYEFRYVECGGVFAVKRSSSGKVVWGAKAENPALSLENPQVPEAKSFVLEPGDRMLLASDGWGEALAKPAEKIFEEFLSANREAQELVNELAFSMRRKLEQESEEPIGVEDEFPMPPQDCSVLLFDLAANVLRLAR